MSQTFVVTGTSRGIGLEMTRQLAESGHEILALARAPKKSKSLIELGEKYPNQIRLFSVDVTSDDQISAFVKELGNQGVDTLINCAGIYGGDADFDKLSFDEVISTFETNAVAPMRMTRALLPFLKKSKNPKLAHITSLMGSITDNESGGSYGYRMSKAALNMFHKTFSIEHPEITCLVLHPGWVKTDMGGAGALVEVSDSVRGLLGVIEKAKLNDSGKFFDFEGDGLPW